MGKIVSNNKDLDREIDSVPNTERGLISDSHRDRQEVYQTYVMSPPETVKKTAKNVANSLSIRSGSPKSFDFYKSHDEREGPIVNISNDIKEPGVDQNYLQNTNKPKNILHKPNENQ